MSDSAKIFTFEIIKEKCHNCGYEFENEWSYNEMEMNFIWLLKCLKCNTLVYFDAYEDKYFDIISKKVKDKLGIKKISTTEEDEIYTKYFSRVFEKIIKPCNCGEKYLIDYYYICPKCRIHGKENFKTIGRYIGKKEIKQIEHIEDIDLDKLIEEIFKEQD